MNHILYLLNTDLNLVTCSTVVPRASAHPLNFVLKGKCQFPVQAHTPIPTLLDLWLLSHVEQREIS